MLYVQVLAYKSIMSMYYVHETPTNSQASFISIQLQATQCNMSNIHFTQWSEINYKNGEMCTSVLKSETCVYNKTIFGLVYQHDQTDVKITCLNHQQ